jgi:hypothetical protein
MNAKRRRKSEKGGRKDKFWRIVKGEVQFPEGKNMGLNLKFEDPSG